MIIIIYPMEYQRYEHHHSHVHCCVDTVHELTLFEIERPSVALSAYSAGCPRYANRSSCYAEPSIARMMDATTGCVGDGLVACICLIRVSRRNCCMACIDARFVGCAWYLCTILDRLTLWESHMMSEGWKHMLRQDDTNHSMTYYGQVNGDTKRERERERDGGVRKKRTSSEGLQACFARDYDSSTLAQALVRDNHRSPRLGGQQ